MDVEHIRQESGSPGAIFFSPLNSLAPTFDADAEASEFGKITIPKPHLMDSGISFWDGSGECAFSSALLVITAADS